MYDNLLNSSRFAIIAMITFINGPLLNISLFFFYATITQHTNIIRLLLDSSRSIFQRVRYLDHCFSHQKSLESDHTLHYKPLPILFMLHRVDIPCKYTAIYFVFFLFFRSQRLKVGMVYAPEYMKELNKSNQIFYILFSQLLIYQMSL